MPPIKRGYNYYDGDEVAPAQVNAFMQDMNRQLYVGPPQPGSGYTQGPQAPPIHHHSVTHGPLHNELVIMTRVDMQQLSHFLQGSEAMIGQMIVDKIVNDVAKEVIKKLPELITAEAVAARAVELMAMLQVKEKLDAK